LRSASQYNNPDSLIGYGLPDFEKAYALGTKEISSSKLKIYPNPFRDSFYVELPDISIDSESFTLSLYDIAGRKLLTRNYSRSKAHAPVKITPPESIEDGVYFLNVQFNEDDRFKVKIIKQ
jgi:hypothetical protein